MFIPHIYELHPDCVIPHAMVHAIVGSCHLRVPWPHLCHSRYPNSLDTGLGGWTTTLEADVAADGLRRRTFGVWVDDGVPLGTLMGGETDLSPDAASLR